MIMKSYNFGKIFTLNYFSNHIVPRNHAVCQCLPFDDTIAQEHFSKMSDLLLCSPCLLGMCLLKKANEASKFFSSKHDWRNGGFTLSVSPFMKLTSQISYWLQQSGKVLYLKQVEFFVVLRKMFHYKLPLDLRNWDSFLPVHILSPHVPRRTISLGRNFFARILMWNGMEKGWIQLELTKLLHWTWDNISQSQVVLCQIFKVQVDVKKLPKRSNCSPELLQIKRLAIGQCFTSAFRLTTDALWTNRPTHTKHLFWNIFSLDHPIL